MQKMSLLRYSLLVAVALVVAGCGSDGTLEVQIPSDGIAAAELESRFNAQIASVDDFQVHFDFEFEDRREESGITFRQHVVDDAGRTFKAAHYDHGTGIAVADVDGDGLLDIYFVNQVGDNELWRNLGDGRFENITDRAGVALGDRISVGASFADINNNGHPDLFVTTVMGGNALFLNDGEGNFTDISAEAGVDHVGHSSGAIFFDFNGNGLLDLFVTNVGEYTSDEIRTVRRDRTNEDLGEGTFTFRNAHEDAFSGHLYPERFETSILYRNLGDGRFEDVTEAMGLYYPEAFSGDAAAFDATGNGWPDLYLMNMQGHDVFFENQEGEGFVDRTMDYFPRSPWGAMGVAVFDHDENGLLDLFLTDMHSDMSVEVGPEHELHRPESIEWDEDFLRSEGRSIFGNAFFAQREPGSFEEIATRIGAQNYWPWGPSIGDLNANGYVDVFVASSMNFPFRYGINTVLLNNAGTGFMHSEFILGVEPRSGPMLAPWFTIDCSGEDRGHEICGGATASFSRWIQGVGELVVMGVVGSRSAVIFDVNGSGAQDIVTMEFGAQPQVLISDLPDRREVRWIQLDLEGVDSNRDGLGARVRVHFGDRVVTRLHDGRSGYLSQSSMPLYVGLDTAESVDRIEVVWPSGQEDVLEGPIEINRTLRLVEGG